MNPKAYKIRNRKTGLYSTGGTEPQWHTRGKVWNSAGALRSHLTQYCDVYRWGEKPRTIPADWEVIELTVSVTEGAPVPASQFHKGAS